MTTKELSKEEVEKLEEEKKVDEALAQVSHNKEIEAVMFLKQAIPMFNTIVYKSSGAVLKRVFNRIMQDPFEDAPFKPTMGEEKSLYTLATQIINAKFILFESSIKSKLSKELENLNKDSAVQASVDTVVENSSTTETIPKENNNG